MLKGETNKSQRHGKKEKQYRKHKGDFYSDLKHITKKEPKINNQDTNKRERGKTTTKTNGCENVFNCKMDKRNHLSYQNDFCIDFPYHLLLHAS